MQKHTKSIFPDSSLETRLSVDISSEKQGWEKNMLSVNWMDKQPRGIDAVLVVGVKQSAPQNFVLVGHKVYHAQMLILPKHESKRDSITER
jgi:ornithine carbamoyltransferase